MPSPLVMQRVVGGQNALAPSSVAGLLVWLRADAGTWQDSAFTTPSVAPSDPVGGWQDQSGNGNHVTQATSSKRPLLIPAAQNGLPVVRFDGVDDYLKAAAFTWSQPCYLIAAWRLRSAVVTRRYLEGNTVAAWIVQQNPNAGDLQLFAGVSGPTLTEGTSGFVTVEVATNRAASYVALGGVASSRLDPSTNGPGGLTLANRADGASSGALDLGELAGFQGIPDPTAISGLRAYFRRRWGTG